MAGPLDSYIQLPTDSGNTGKKVRSQTRVVGADTVHEHYFIPISKRKLTGVYNVSSALQSVAAAAQNATSTGFLWWEMPTTATTARARLRKLKIEHGMSAELDMITVPRIGLAKFTFSGTASGTPITPAKRITADATSQSNVRIAVTGMTVVLDALAWATLVPAYSVTTSGIAWAAGPIVQWDPANEDEFIDIGPGEGLVLYQLDAGTAADTRRFNVTLTFDEYDNA